MPNDIFKTAESVLFAYALPIYIIFFLISSICKCLYEVKITNEKRTGFFY